MRERVCKNCGGREYKIVGQNMVKCCFCGTLYVDEHANKEEEVLLALARDLLRELRFEEAVEEFEKILSLFPLSFEAFFGKCLAKNKIVLYSSKKGTLNRPRFFGEIVSILDDVNFNEAIKLAPAETKANYEKIAKNIEKIKKDYDEKDCKQSYDVVMCAVGFDKANPDEKVLKTYENLQNNGKKVYFLQDLPQKEHESQTFCAIEKSKCLLFFAQSKTGYGEFKHILDRFGHFVALRKKAKTSFILAIDEWVIRREQLPREFSFCKNVIDTNSVSFLEDVQVLVENEINNFVGQTAKIDTVKLKKVQPNKKEYVDIETVNPIELGHYEIENVNLSEKNKIKWIFLSLKNGDFGTAQELVEKGLEIDPYNSQLIFADLMAKRQIKTQEEFFSKISNFSDKETIDNILRYASKDFAQDFVDQWENLIVDLNQKELYLNFLIYLASFQSPNRARFIQSAQNMAVETLDEDLIEKVLQCFDKQDVDRFVEFYFALAQKSDDVKYYQKILELDEGHFQSHVALFLRKFKTVNEKLTHRDDEEMQSIFKFFDENARFQFVSILIDLILEVAFVDLKEAEMQFDFYLSYLSDDEKLCQLSTKIAESLQHMHFFKLAEKYISISISKDKQNDALYWLLIQIKAHCCSDNELITSQVKIMQFPEWETLLEVSDDQHDEFYAGIVSKSNLYEGEKSSFQPDLLDKAELKRKIQNFLTRNANVLLEIEKENAQAVCGVNYYRSQFVPFEKYVSELEEVDEFEKFLQIKDKVEIRLKNLDLSLDESVNVTKLIQRCGDCDILLSKVQENANKQAKSQNQSGKKSKFIKRFSFVFFEIVPLLFSMLLLVISLINPKEVFMYFSQDFLVCMLIYSVAVGMGNLCFYVVKKQKTTKSKISFLSLIGLGFVNLVLFCMGFYFSSNVMEIENAKQFDILLHNARYASFKLTKDIDFGGKTWKSCDFVGTLDANGQTVSNISLSGGGLFLNNGGTIKNLNVNLSQINLQDVKTYGLIANSNTGTVENCVVSGKITLATNINAVLGGLVGKNVGGTILHCQSNLEIVVDLQAGSITLGGLVGEVLNGKNKSVLCENLSSTTLYVVSNTKSEVYVGGFAGKAKKIKQSTIKENISECQIVVESNISNVIAGGMFGLCEIEFSDSYAQGKISTNQVSKGFVGGLVGRYINSDVNQQVIHCYANVLLETNCTYGTIVGELGGEINSCFGVGDADVKGKRVEPVGRDPNCESLKDVFYDKKFEFDESVWQISLETYPKLLWQQA